MFAAAADRAWLTCLQLSGENRGLPLVPGELQLFGLQIELFKCLPQSDFPVYLFCHQKILPLTVINELFQFVQA